ncbi:MAG: hypothetical protein ABR923_17265 [Terracidiphilus sp.]|jgi:hypothetical protein
MGDEKKYRVFGYPAKTDPDWSIKGKLVGSVDDIQDAHKMKNNAIAIGFDSVIILDGELIIE